MTDDRREINSTTGIAGKVEVKLPEGRTMVSASAPRYRSVIKGVEVKGKTKIVVKLIPCEDPREMFPAPLPLPGQRYQPAPVWQPQPALIIGLGGTGRQVLTHLKKNLLDAGFGHIPDSVRLILLDTSDYELLDGQKVPVSFAGVSLSPEDIVEFGEDLQDVVDILIQDENAEPEISKWFPKEDYKSHLSADELNLSHGTRQRRPLARAALMRDVKKGIPTNAVDIVLIIDHSTSMSDYFANDVETISKLDAAKRAASQFVEQLNLALDRISVVQFSETAEVVHPLSQDLRSVKQAIYNIEPGGDTAIDMGLQAAQQALGTRDSNSAQMPVAVLLSDGQSAPGIAIEMADRLKRAGVRLITVGIGDANAGLLQQVATEIGGKPEYYYAPTSRDLAKIYIQLARQLGEGSRLLRLLHGAARMALDEKELRVIIAGSLSGGFGSGVLADIAYLARRVGKAVGATSISVESYLASDGVFNQVSQRLEVNAVNTWATLRELERFQLAKAYPFRMTYRQMPVQDPIAPILDGKIDWRLFDEIYLFDSLPGISPDTPQQQKDWYKPTISVFPAIADVISLWLDKASRSGGLRDYRSSIQGDVTSEQRSRGRAVIGGMGVYTYRVPMYDLVEILKIRWARSLLRFLIAGAVDAKIRLDVSLNQEAVGNDLSRHIMLFLFGTAGYENPACPEITPAIGFLVFDPVSSDGLDLIKKSDPLDINEITVQYRAYLAGALVSMLNGLKSSSVVKARSGKIGYVLAFLKTLEQTLGDGLRDISPEQAPAVSVMQAYLNETQSLSQSLKKQVTFLSQQLSIGEQVKEPGIYEQLENLEQGMLNRFEELDSILTRRYIHVENLLDDWYKKYFANAAFQQDSLGRLFWKSTQHNDVALTLKTWDEHPLHSNSASQQTFINELLRIGAYGGRELLEKESLASILSETALNKENLPDTAALLKAGAKELLQFDSIKMPHAKSAFILGINPTVVQRNDLADLIKQGMVSDRKLTMLEITDPFSMLLVQTTDVIPVDAITSLSAAESRYMGWYGLTPRVAVDLRSEPTSVFRGERVALSLEQRLQPELRQAPRLLRPVIVVALDNDAAARAYVLALAANWIRSIGQQVILFLPDGGQTPITSVASSSTSSMHLLVLGFVKFSEQATPNQAESLSTALKQAGQEVINQWRVWTSPNWQNHPVAVGLISADKDAVDLAAVVALMVREELRKQP